MAFIKFSLNYSKFLKFGRKLQENTLDHFELFTNQISKLEIFILLIEETKRSKL